MIFRRNRPEKPKASPWVKASDQISGPPKISTAWATARRAQMKIFEDRIEIGDWTIPFEAVTEATLWETPPPIPGRLLEIVTPERTVQINFNPGTDVTPHLPFDIARMPAPEYLTRARTILYAVAGGTILFVILLSYWDL